MNVTITVPESEAGGSLRFEWDEGFEIRVSRSASEIAISANEAELISLARHLLTLAQANVAAGSHIHLSETGELEDGSGDLILEKRA